MSLKLISTTFTIFLCALLAMAFFTLFERKMLGYIQLRKGPNKVSLSGIPQPMADAMKLFTKQLNLPKNANTMMFILAPMLALFLALTMWTLYPFTSTPLFMKWNILFFLSLSSMNVYTTLLSGWASNSKYSLLGALRSIAQTISYEVTMALVIISPMIMMSTMNFNTFSKESSFMFTFMLWPLLTMWLITSLAETNRTPFDLAEGESELVSGFNTEYSSGPFALIFMAEYMNIIVMSMITATMFFYFPSPAIVNELMFVLSISIISTIMVWARGAYPRMRYDKLMSLTWKQFLPATLMIIMLISCMST